MIGSGAVAFLLSARVERGVLTLNGTLRLHNDLNQEGFGRWAKTNEAVLRDACGVDLFAGSLNVEVLCPLMLQRELDAGRPPPAFVIPGSKLNNLGATYLADGQAWAAELRGDKFPRPVRCWIFRRNGSQVPTGVIEIVARDGLVAQYDLQHGDSVIIDILSR